MKHFIDFGKLFLKVTLNCLERPFLIVWEQLHDSTQLFSRWAGFFNKIYKEPKIADQLEIVAHMPLSELHVKKGTRLIFTARQCRTVFFNCFYPVRNFFLTSRIFSIFGVFRIFIFFRASIFQQFSQKIKKKFRTGSEQTKSSELDRK